MRPRALVIRDVTTSMAKPSLLKNNAAGMLRVIAVRTPGFGDRVDVLDDIAALTGATIFAPQRGREIDNVHARDL